MEQINQAVDSAMGAAAAGCCETPFEYKTMKLEDFEKFAKLQSAGAIKLAETGEKDELLHELTQLNNEVGHAIEDSPEFRESIGALLMGIAIRALTPTEAMVIAVGLGAKIQQFAEERKTLEALTGTKVQ